MKIVNYFTGILFLAALAVSCSKDDNQGGGYSGKKATVYVISESGTHDFNIRTTGRWSAEAANSATRRWLSIEGTAEGQGSATISLRYRANTSFPREGRIIVTLADTQVADTIVVRQYGLTPVVEFRQPTAAASAMGSELPLGIATNVTNTMKERVRISLIQVSGTEGQWIEEPVFNDDFSALVCKVGANRDTDRSARVILAFTDDWGETYTSDCLVSQLSLGGTPDTKAISFAEVRALVTGSEADIDSDLSIEGFVVSDCTSPNVAENPNLSTTTIDYTKNYRTVYLQSLDGQFGFALEYDKQAENAFRQFDRLQLWLKGTHIVKQTSPERYTISGLNSKSIINLTPSSASDLPAKEKYISELTASDLYTRVTLKDCEFPVRKGSYTPINEGYGSAYGAYRVDKYPLAVRDAKGGHLHLYTNLSAPWRRDGSALPQGAGKLTGVVVSESYERFEKDGNIGDLQLRPIFPTDIDLAPEADKGFSKVIAAWNAPVKENNLLKANIGTGYLSHTSTAYTGTAYNTNDFSMPGPIDGTTDNKGVTANMGWANAYWWDSANNCGESWVVKFSTAGISAQHIALTVSTMHNAIGAPRYWVIEWSEHGDKLGAWSKVAEYTVPDPVQWGNTLYTQLSGSKNISVELPNEVLGKSTVYVRLKPSRNTAGTATAYDGAAIKSGSASALSYVAIHYNN